MADKEVKSVGFSLTKSMIKLVQDVESGIIPLEGEKQEDGVEWVKNKGQNFALVLSATISLFVDIINILFQSITLPLKFER